MRRGPALRRASGGGGDPAPQWGAPEPKRARAVLRRAGPMQGVGSGGGSRPRQRSMGTRASRAQRSASTRHEGDFLPKTRRECGGRKLQQTRAGCGMPHSHRGRCNRRCGQGAGRPGLSAGPAHVHCVTMRLRRGTRGGTNGGAIGEACHTAVQHHRAALLPTAPPAAHSGRAGQRERTGGRNCTKHTAAAPRAAADMAELQQKHEGRQSTPRTAAGCTPRGGGGLRPMYKETNSTAAHPESHGRACRRPPTAPHLELVQALPPGQGNRSSRLAGAEEIGLRGAPHTHTCAANPHNL